MTIKVSPKVIECDYCGNCDYYFGTMRSVEIQARGNGWIRYKGKHFDTKECLDKFKERLKDI